MDSQKNSGNYNTGNCNSGDYNSGNCNSGHYNSGNCNSGTGNTGYYNSGDFNTGHCNSGDYNSGNCNTGHCNSGDYNSGNCNSGDYNYGIFNTDNPTIRCFNKETGINRKGFKFPDMTEFELTEYKNGKLVTYDYKEAWKKFWNSISEDRKQEFLNLPNFDSTIFKEITGIKTQKIYNKQTLLNTINLINNLENNIEKQKKEVAKLKEELNNNNYKSIKLELL